MNAAPYAKWLLLPLVAAVIFGLGHFLTLGEVVRYQNNEVYLLRYASIVTPGGGVYGFAPGTRLTVDPTRRPSPDTVFVTDGTHGLAIDPYALTHDPDRARALAVGDQQAQALSAAAIIAEKARIKKAENDAQLSRARDIDRLNAQQRGGLPPPPPPPPTPTPPPPVRATRPIR